LRCIDTTLHVESRSEPVKIVFLGDTHLGNGDTDEDLVKQTAKRLGEAGVYWVDLGDACDFINMQDKRFDAASLPPWIGLEDLADLATAQVQRYVDIFKPYAPTCLCRLQGNHEDSIRKRYERDVYREINALMGVGRDRAPGYGCFLRLRVYRMEKSDPWTLVCFLHHGVGGGMLAGAKALRLERLPMSFDADIFAVGHTHTKLALSKRRIGLHPRGKKVVDKPLALINTGAFMRSYVQNDGGYVEGGLLYPQGLGPVEVWIWPDKKDIKVVQ